MRPPGDVVQMTAFQFGQVTLIRPDGSHYNQVAASWQWVTNDSRFLPPAASVDPRLPMSCFTPSIIAQPWGMTHEQPVQPGVPLQQWIAWKPVGNMPTPPALPAPRTGLIRRLLGGGR